MLVGEYHNKVGEKNRVALPKQFREELGEDIIITRGYEDCLVVVNENQWEKLLDSVKDQPFTKSSVRDTRRFLIGGAKQVDLDKQGRFVLAENLKEHAEIKKEVVFIGLGDWIEIWDKERWTKRLDYLRSNSAQIAEKLDAAVNEERR